MKKHWKRFLTAILVLAFVIPAFVIGAAELLNITTAGVNGDWYIYDKSGNTICYFDAANRKLVFPSGSALDVKSGGTLTVKSGGALTIDSGATFTLTGYVAGKLPVSTFATTVAYSPTSAAMDEHLYRISSAESVYLPLGSVGMTAVFRAIPGTVTLYPSTGDHWQYANSTATAGSAIQLPGALGNWVKVVYGALSVWEVQGVLGTITVP